MGVELSSGSAQDIGARPNQQDSLWVGQIPGDGMLAVLCDGMGGMDDGQLASQTAVNAFRDCFLTRGSLDEAVRIANAAVSGLLRKTGTTLIAAHVTSTHFEWISVGDSPLYLFRNGTLQQVNRPHIYANHLSPEEAAVHPERDSLTSFIGIPVLVEIDRSSGAVPLSPGDRVVLASDGLSRALPIDEIAARIRTAAQVTCDSLIEAVLARRRQGQDNVSVVTLFVGEDVAALPPPPPIVHKSQSGSYSLIALLFVLLIAAGIAWHFLQPQPPPAVPVTPANAQDSRPERQAGPTSEQADPAAANPPQQLDAQEPRSGAKN